ncbi:MAG: ATP-binding protein [Bacteroidota bacterium]
MSLTRISVILLGVVLVPALFYIAYEVKQVDEQEAMMVAVYEQQLETLLYSVNQHAWDTVSDWADALEWELRQAPNADGARDFLSEQPLMTGGVVLIDSLRQSTLWIMQDTTVTSASIVADSTARRLRSRLGVGYRQLEPILLQDAAAVKVVMLYALEDAGALHFAGLVLDQNQFIETEVAPKLRDVGRTQFELAICQGPSAVPVIATGDVSCTDIEYSRALWVFPDHTICIKPTEQAAIAMLDRRLWRNLSTAGGLTVVLLMGVGFVLYTVRREMRLAQMKSDFVSNVSHELRTPLSLIRMFAETLEMGRVRDDAKRQEYYRIIGMETERLTHLINNILDFSRMEAGQKTYRFAPLDLNALVRSTLKLYSYKLSSGGFQVETHLASDLPHLHADHDALTEALINLIENAIKYSPDAKHLAVTTERVDGALALRVTDHGCGISEADQQRVFDKFFRVSTGLVHDTKGTGLGLSLVQHIVNAHDGHMTVESTLGQGSTFSILLPLPPPA